MTFRVDLRTPILTAQHNAFMARPGKASSYLPQFEEEKAIGPIFPGLQLRPGTPIDDQEGIENALTWAHLMKTATTAEIDRRFRNQSNVVIRARHLQENFEAREWHRDFASPGMRPGTRQQYRAILKGYFERAQKGDLVVIPSQSYLEESLLAEFTGGPNDIVYMPLMHKGFTWEIPARRFRLLEKIEKRLLPPSLLKIMEKPSAFVQIGERDTRSLLEMAYGSFAVQQVYTSEIKVESGSLSPAVSSSLFRLLESLVGDEEENVAIHINVNSPGFIRIVTRSAKSFVYAVLLAIAVKYGVEFLDQYVEAGIEIFNSLSDNVDCSITVREDAMRRLQNFSVEEWTKICEDAASVSNSLEMSVQPQVHDGDE